MDEHYWAKKYHEAEAERVEAQKRIEELEEDLDQMERTVMFLMKQNAMNPDTTMIHGLVCSCGNELRPLTMKKYLESKSCPCSAKKIKIDSADGSSVGKK